MVEVTFHWTNAMTEMPESSPPLEQVAPLKGVTRVNFMGGIVTLLLIFMLGFVLGFFPAILGDGGTLSKGVDHGWKFGLVFVGTMLSIGLVYLVLKRTPLPELAIYIAMGMVGMAIMNTIGGLATGDYRTWQQNLVRGLGSGAIFGGVIYWVQRRSKRFAARGNP